MKPALLTLSALIAISFGSNGLAADLTLGQNHLICENEDFGSFDLILNVKDNVIDREYYKAENEEPVLSWETLESELTELEFTSGQSLQPVGVTTKLPGTTIKVLRNVFHKNPGEGQMNAYLDIPKNLGFPIETLMIDYTHPKEYGSAGVGAQTFFWANGRLLQLFFKCR